ncbi:MAG: hypothetical protein JSR82_06645 [Verrucomicrobia bacterium]|nr:hypothetical protein [Verrucomicrobiota bacterium]
MNASSDPTTTVPAAPAGQSRPEFIRLPPPTRKGGPPAQYCRWTGLSRAKLNQLILPGPHNDHRPPVKSHCLRSPGCAKGVRLIHLESLLAYIRSQEN